MMIEKHRPAGLPVFTLWLALTAVCALAQTPSLKLRFGFDEASGTTTASDMADGGVSATLQLLDYSGAPADRHGPAGSGVASSLTGKRALDFSSPLGQGTNGPVAALTNASLGFGDVTTFTATLWFKARSQQPANIGPRLFLLGAADTAADTGATNSIGPGQWVVVAAPAFAAALAPLVDQRRADGFKVSVLATTNVLTRDQIRAGDAAPLRDRLQALFGNNLGPKYLLLAGAGAGPGASAEVVVPPLSGTTARMQGQLTDFGYALPDPAGRPTVAVGRFPARSSDELQGMVAKTLRLERARSRGLWRAGLLLVQGNPGGGSMPEIFLNGITQPRLERLHPAWQLSAISHNAFSLYYLPTAWLQSRTLEWLSAGQLFSLYLGHSDPSGWSTLNTNFMSARDWARIDMGQGQGVLFSCGCFGCQWDRGQEQAYGLAAIRNPTGPAAVIGAYGESYSAPGLLAVDGLLRCCTEPPFPTRLADYWLAVQLGLAEGEIDPSTFALLDMADGTGGKQPLSAQRREHLEMWTLLGDPALRLPILPLTISMKATSLVSPARRLNIEGTLPGKFAGATVRVNLERPIGARPEDLQPLPARSADGAAERDRVAAENHRKVNNRLISTAIATAEGTRFACSLELPANLVTPMVVVRAYAQAGDEAAQGVLKLPAMPAAAP